MPKDWKELSKAASCEQDTEKLLQLVEELDKALEQCEKTITEKQHDSVGTDPSRTTLHSRFGMDEAISA